MTKDTKTALLDSAERAARARGFDGFSYADLSVDVGIRKASIHHHFPTKAALSQALMLRYTETLREVCAQISFDHTTAGARLNALIERYRIALSGGESLCLCVAFSTSRDSLPNDVTRTMSAFRTMMIDWLASTFEMGKSDGSIKAVQDPRAEGAAMLALLEGAQLTARVEMDLTLFENATLLLRARLSASPGQ